MIWRRICCRCNPALLPDADVTDNRRFVWRRPHGVFAFVLNALATGVGGVLCLAAATTAVDLKLEQESQFADLNRQLKERAAIQTRAAQAFHREAVIQDSDRDPADIVLRRTDALLAHLQASLPSPRFNAFKARLATLKECAVRTDTADTSARHRLYQDACGLRRQIAFANPLLNFDKVVFIKRHPSRFNHMCDQYYGFNAVQGGGLYVLEKPFSSQPVLRDLLAGAVCENGRLQGRKLTPGAFLSPDLSCDGKTILFAYTEAEQDPDPKAKTHEWNEHSTFHIFRVNSNGTGLVQLTDGKVNDFDPCALPDGRIAFISERRGGYIRCSGDRPVTTYTLHRMDADGRNIVCLSFHETNEWQPSVNHDGMIVYTRWDYVDRDSDIAHHAWLTTPDGRDARAFHGNYPMDRTLRPWMEMNLRAIPGSRKYIATAAPHHGQNYGSLVMLDPAVEDDNAMSQLKRLTPDVAFPESEKGSWAFATPWPLSEDYYLCAYDPAAKTHGLYLVDSFGNRELLYRDPAIGCLYPMPLQARPTPPVVPASTATASTDAEGVVTIVNVYDSQKPWPKDTKIAALRVIQVLPKTTWKSNAPRVGIASQANARAVLGTVPVAADGSARFYAPTRKPLYFQALDEKGLAIQSMRSITYLQPGESLTCRGCHESRHSAPSPTGSAPLAAHRTPARIQPDVDGSNPFNYPRLVQPVLDHNCVACHSQNRKTPKLAGTPAGANGWSQSYASLASKYGFYFNVSNGAIKDPVHGGATSTPGQFGARASRLFQLLDRGHHDVKLSVEDIHRLTLWLDCNSDFFGAYEELEKQGRGEIVKITLE